MIGEGEHKCYTVLITHSIAAVCDIHTHQVMDVKTQLVTVCFHLLMGWYGLPV